MMKYKLFGTSGLRVAELSLGALTFGTEMGWGEDKAECRRVFDAYVRGGRQLHRHRQPVHRRYERTLCRRIRRRRSRPVRGRHQIHPQHATRRSERRRQPPQEHGAVARGEPQAAGTGYVDLFWLHPWDFITPVDEVMRGLDDLVRAGKVLYVGISDTPAWVVAQANTLAELRGWSRFAGLQIEYSLIDRAAERELLPMARSLGLATTAWGVVGQGVLTGKFHRAADPHKAADTRRAAMTARHITERNLAIARVVEEVAAAKGCSMTQVAINWVRQQDQQMIPVVGATHPRPARGQPRLPRPAAHSGRPVTARRSEPNRSRFPARFSGHAAHRRATLRRDQERVENHRPLSHLPPRR